MKDRAYKAPAEVAGYVRQLVPSVRQRTERRPRVTVEYLSSQCAGRSPRLFGALRWRYYGRFRGPESH